jgi:hypothetical protein
MKALATDALVNGRLNGTKWAYCNTLIFTRKKIKKLFIWINNYVCEKPSGQFLGLIVMSHWLGEVW